MKLSTGLENFKGEVSDDLSSAAVEIDKNYWLALPWWRNLCHRLSCDQPQRPREAEKRDPGNEVARRLGVTEGFARHEFLVEKETLIRVPFK